MIARMTYGNTGKGTTTAQWGLCSPVLLQSLITTVTDQGGAILLGYSRDQGSYRIIIMDGDDKATKWIPCTTDIDEAIEDLISQLWPEQEP